MTKPLGFDFPKALFNLSAWFHTQMSRVAERCGPNRQDRAKRAVPVRLRPGLGVVSSTVSNIDFISYIL